MDATEELVEFKPAHEVLVTGLGEVESEDELDVYEFILQRAVIPEGYDELIQAYQLACKRVGALSDPVVIEAINFQKRRSSNVSRCCQ